MKKTSTSNYLFFPTKNDEFLMDSQGKPRVYKTLEAMTKNLKQDWDKMVVYALDDIVSREEVEKLLK